MIMAGKPACQAGGRRPAIIMEEDERSANGGQDMAVNSATREVVATQAGCHSRMRLDCRTIKAT